MADKALLIGINDYKTISGLRGCRNDVERMRAMLLDIFAFPAEAIRTRFDGEAIKTVIDADMDWLLEDAGPGDRLLMHFSGHGSYTADEDAEPDEGGSDELLCLYNMNWDDPDSYLLDDEIAAFTRRVPEGAQLVLVLDSCHSGTGSRADPSAARRGTAGTPAYTIPLVKDIEGRSRGTRGPSNFRIRFAPPPQRIERAARRAGTDRSLVASVREAIRVEGLNHILLAGAKDIETAADAPIDDDYFGAFSYHLTDAFRAMGQDADRRELIERVEEAVASYGQTPQLEADDLTGPLYARPDFPGQPVDVAVPAVRIEADMASTIGRPDSAGGVDPETFRRLLKIYNRLLDLAGAARSDIDAARRDGAGRHLVTVHGIGRHPVGYSNTWWNALQPYAPSLHPGRLAGPVDPSGNRHEVRWSEIVNRAARDLSTRRAAEETAEEIKAALQDRTDQAFENAPEDQAREAMARGSTVNLFTSVDDFTVYLIDRSTRDRILQCFFDVVRPLLRAGAELEIIGHSWGTVVAYEGLVLLEREAAGWSGRVHSFFTAGSALSIGPVRSQLLPAAADGHKPRMVDRWVNLDARHDIVGGRLDRYFAVDREELGLDPTNCGFLNAVCAHSSYFDRDNVGVNRDIFGRTIER